MKFIGKFVAFIRRPKVVDLEPVETEVYFDKDPVEDEPHSRMWPENEPFGSERDALQLSIAVLQKDTIEQAKIGLTLLILVNNPSISLSVDQPLEAADIVDILPDILIPTAQELIDGLLRAPKPFRKVAFAQPTDQEKSRGDFDSAKRRSCFQVDDVDAVRSALGNRVKVHFMRPVGH